MLSYGYPIPLHAIALLASARRLLLARCLFTLYLNWKFPLIFIRNFFSYLLEISFYIYRLVSKCLLLQLRFHNFTSAKLHSDILSRYKITDNLQKHFSGQWVENFWIWRYFPKITPNGQYQCLSNFPLHLLCTMGITQSQGLPSHTSCTPFI